MYKAAEWRRYDEFLLDQRGRHATELACKRKDPPTPMITMEPVSACTGTQTTKLLGISMHMH